MNVEIIEMPRHKAREAFEHYQKAVRSDRPGMEE